MTKLVMMAVMLGALGCAPSFVPTDAFRTDVARPADANERDAPDAVGPDAPCVRDGCGGSGLCCFAGCVNQRTDRANCGGCGLRCGVGFECRNAICLP